MKTLLTAIMFACMASSSSANDDGDAPRWFFLGEDEDLRRTFTEAQEVVFLCIFATDLEDVRPPFAKVVHRATVVSSFKGDLKIGDKIEVVFATDSLPATEEEREAFIKRARGGGEVPRSPTEFLYLPKYRTEMSDFLNMINESRKKENKVEMATPRKPSD